MSEEKSRADEYVSLIVMIVVALTVIFWSVPNPIIPQPQSLSWLTDLTGIDEYTLRSIAQSLLGAFTGLAAGLSYMHWRGKLKGGI